MSAVKIVASAASDSSKDSAQVKTFYDGTRWWAFYKRTASWQTIYYKFSTDNGATWSTELSKAFTASLPLAAATTGDCLSVVYDSGSQTILVTNADTTGGNPNILYFRGVLNATPDWTWDTTSRDFTDSGTAAQTFGMNIAQDSAGKVIVISADSSGNPQVTRSTNALGISFTDQGGSIAIVGTIGNIGGQSFKEDIHGLASTNILAIYTDQVTTHTVAAKLWNGTSWSAATNMFDGANVSESNWGSCKVSNTFVALLGQTGASAFSFQKFDGTNWGPLTAPSWPTSGLATNSQVALISDGTDVWAFVIRGDANNSVAYEKYHGTTWSGSWTDLETSNAVRTYISPVLAYANGTAACQFLQVNGANTDLYWVSLAVAGPIISVQPNNASVNEFSTANFTFTAAASGGGSITQQWKYAGLDGIFHNVSLGSGGTSASFTTAPTNNNEAQNTFTYKANIVETGGSSPGNIDTNTVTLTVVGEGKISTPDYTLFSKTKIANRALGLS